MAIGWRATHKLLHVITATSHIVPPLELVKPVGLMSAQALVAPFLLAQVIKLPTLLSGFLLLARAHGGGLSTHTGRAEARPLTHRVVKALKHCGAVQHLFHASGSRASQAGSGSQEVGCHGHTSRPFANAV